MPVLKSVANRVANYQDPNSFAVKLRRKRFALLLRMIDQTFAEKGGVEIIDIGGTRSYWNTVGRDSLAEKNVRITLVNLPGTTMPPDDEHFRFVPADACDLSVFPDKSFDIAHSNSVIEHVGDWKRMVQFSREVTRVAEHYFVQTPNYWFPIEPHAVTPFFHWMPKPMRVWLVRQTDLGHWTRKDTIDEAVRTVESARLLTRTMLQELFPDAMIATEKLAMLPKSHIAIKA
jgi:SAM-dependent methyltransferase